MKKQIIATALVALGCGPAVWAQQEAGAGAGIAEEDELAVLPEFKSVDANEDGMIDTAEGEMLTDTLKEEHNVEFQFETVDRSQDGLIDVREYTAYDATLKQQLGIS